MEKIFKQALLYDFYGELLTEHQRSIYEEAVYNDMSLGEIAQEYGISRQGVHDLIRRCDKILQGYEVNLPKPKKKWVRFWRLWKSWSLKVLMKSQKENWLVLKRFRQI